jgi:hypothetical protein
MNMHPHAWPLYDTAKLIGVSFTPAGLDLSPALPLAEYRFESPLIGLEKRADGYSGWYAPMRAGTWQMRLHIPEAERVRFQSVEVNGRLQEVQVDAQGALCWSGASTLAEPLRWRVNFLPHF